MVGFIADCSLASSLLQDGGCSTAHAARGPVQLQVAELPFDEQDAGGHVRVLEGHVGQWLDIQPWGHLDDLGSVIGTGQGTPDPGAQVAHGLGWSRSRKMKERSSATVNPR
jgi:hypothetical protein